MPRADVRAGLLAATLALALAGCGAAGDPQPVPTPTHLGLETIAPGDTGTNGIEHLTGADVLRESLAAIGRAEGVQFAFAFDDGSRALEVRYDGRPGAATATITTVDGVLDLALGEESGTARGTGDLAARYALTGTATCLPADDPVFAEWAGVLDLETLLRDLTAAVTLRRGALVDGDPPTVDVVLESAGGVVGSLVVSARGEPLPLRLTLADESGSAELQVTGWGTAPAPADC